MANGRSPDDLQAAVDAGVIDAAQAEKLRAMRGGSTPAIGPDGIPALAYGIRTDFQTRAFPGSARLLELAHSLEELKMICRCGRKALFNARLVGGRFVFDGDQVAIDELSHEKVTYESMCAECYLRESGGRLS